MTPDRRDDRDDEFLIASCQAMAGPSGAAALDALGWWDLLPHLADDDARTAVFATFRAQGRELADSAALGGILAQPYVEPLGLAPGAALAPMRRASLRRGEVWTVIGDVDSRSLVFDQPGVGAHVVAAADLVLEPVAISGRATVHEVVVDLTSSAPSLPEAQAEPARVQSQYLGRVAAAAEILGAAERALDTAIAHATDREQFGRPIGTFQALRHILSWAKTDCTAIDSTVRTALLLLDDPPARYGEVVKALAGRNGRRACERSLQALGGIGFTAEHPHHHHHSRVLLLDALLGSSAELTHDLGAWLRTQQPDPGFAAAVLAAPPR
ncbi:acyl-CoA dehydrogenase family protein [Aquihabitans sp. McL0605]|uniref:acyl-CoA dehydrogenase family protein n=1 Tax=Aquihabitans sp. McL0605 TaxID=3415671 RepID=UPI003CEF0A9D